MTYQLYNSPLEGQENGICRHNDDGSSSYIPADINNRDWVEYQAWLDLGNTPEAA